MALPAPGGNTVAVKYIGLVPSIQGFEKNLGRELAGSAVTAQASNAGRSIGSRLASSAVSAVKTGLKIGAVVGGAVAAVTIKGGLDRALGIEDARAKMSGLGYSTKDVEKIMNNALGAVEGTAYGLDSAATTAAGAVAAGIKPGKELEGVLTTVANTASASGTSMEEMGGIFNTVAAVGSAYTGDINMLAQRGIPIWQSLSDTLGVSQEEVRKMATQGKIDFATFEAAAKDAAGGVAESMGQTTRGTFMNMMAAVNRLGATFVTGLLPLAKTAMTGMTGLIDAVNAKFGPFVEMFFEKFGGSAEAGIKGFFDNLIAGVENFDPGVIMGFFRGVAEFVDGLDFSSFSGFFESLSGVDLSGLSGIFSGGGGDAGGFSSIGASLQTIWEASPQLVVSVLELLAGAMSFLAEHSDTLVKLMPVLVAGFIAYKVATQAGAAATQALVAADIVSLPLQIARNVTSQQAAVARFRAAMATRGEVAADATKTASTVRATVAERIRTIATNIGAAASKAAALATRALGAAIRFATGPIGLIITGVTLLVGALIWFFTQTEVGQKLWSKIWGWIKDAAAAVVDWFMTTALPFLQAAWQGIAAGALWLYNNAILPAWNGIKTAIAAVGNWITGTLWPAIQTAWQGIATGAQWLYRNIILPVWTGIKTAIAIVVTAILIYIDLVIWSWRNIMAPVALWLYRNIILPVWNAIKAAIGAVVNWFVQTAWPMLQRAWQAVANAARWLYGSVILPVWNAIKTAIGTVVNWVKMAIQGWILFYQTVVAPAFRWLYTNVILPVWNAIKRAISVVVNWFKNVAWPLVSMVITWLRIKFDQFRLGLAIIWNFIKVRIIAPVVNWFRYTVWPILSNVLDRVKTGFTNMKNRLRDVWNSIRYNVIRPVVVWFRDTIKPIFDTVTDGISDAFDLLKDAVGTAWDGIRNAAKEPVKFLVETIIRDGIIKRYNSVAEGVFGLKPVDTDQFNITGWRKGGILPGYTPMGRGDDVMTPMRSGEGVLVSEGLRDPRSRDAFLAANAAAKRGTSFSDFLSGGYADGGIVKLRSPFTGSYPRGDGFGARGGKHKGIDWPMASGTTLKAVAAGRVGHSWNPSAGRKLELSIGNGLVAGYHHLSSYIAKRGASVGRGTDVARVGSTGRSSGPHLHFSLRKDGKYVDPAPYLGAGGAAGTGGGGGILNPFAGLWDSLKEKVRNGVGDSKFGDMLYAAPKKIIGGAVNWAKEKLAAIGDFGAEAVAGVGNRVRWSPVMSQALGMKGQMGMNRLRWGLNRLMQESGGDPNAVNNWDSNAKRGTPSKGLMQVIGPTFRAYAEPGYSSNILDPLSNILASINYTLATYGSLQKGWTRKGGYAEGGIINPILHDSGGRLDPGISVIANKTRRPETILPPEESAALTKIANRGDRDGGGASYSFGDIYGHTAADVEREIEKNRRRREALRGRV